MCLRYSPGDGETNPEILRFRRVEWGEDTHTCILHVDAPFIPDFETHAPIGSLLDRQTNGGLRIRGFKRIAYENEHGLVE